MECTTYKQNEHSKMLKILFSLQHIDFSLHKNNMLMHESLSYEALVGWSFIISYYKLHFRCSSRTDTFHCKIAGTQLGRVRQIFRRYKFSYHLDMIYLDIARETDIFIDLATWCSIFFNIQHPFSSLWIVC